LAPISENALLKLPSFENRKNFVFIGNFLHEPNWNAVQYLKENIWNGIHKEIPDATLEIYGAYPSQKVFQLHQPKNNFLIKGRADDAFEIIKNAKVLLAPLRFGAGIKGKLIDAMQMGTPNVTTNIGAEAMHGNLTWSGSISNTAEEFAKAAIKLYQNKELWEKSQQNGFKIINENFQKEMFESDFIQNVVKIESNLTTHRKHNFLGQMLQHHTLLSVKYLSRWIEEKNK
ncbi:MAG: glycosyltransferase family 4 protein, partial [Sphingobacteriaceae bacterium]|nr:glycosyltransferase family 4 protein [Sphingobacteriaceae bacterium]